MEQTTAFSLRQNRGDQGDPDQSFKLKLKNVHTALVKMDNIGGGGGRVEREGANKRALALIFKRNYCIQFSTFIAPWGWELP